MEPEIQVLLDGEEPGGTGDSHLPSPRLRIEPNRVEIRLVTVAIRARPIQSCPKACLSRDSSGDFDAEVALPSPPEPATPSAHGALFFGAPGDDRLRPPIENNITRIELALSQNALYLEAIIKLRFAQPKLARRAQSYARHHGYTPHSPHLSPERSTVTLTNDEKSCHHLPLLKKKSKIHRPEGISLHGYVGSSLRNAGSSKKFDSRNLLLFRRLRLYRELARILPH